MATSEKITTPEKPEEGFAQTWRFKLGLGLFLLGNVVVVIVMLLSVFGLVSGDKLALVGALVIGGELITLSSIIFLGKAGFLVLKKKIFGFVKSGYDTQVGPVRHYFGIALFFVCMVTTYLTVLYAWTAFGNATVDQPMPTIWGLEFANQGKMITWLFLIGELSLLTSIYVLGADWWERFREVVIWKKPTQDGRGCESR